MRSCCWIGFKYLKYRGIRIPERFLRCIKEGSWLKITVNGCSGWRPPSQSFLFGSSLGNILQNGSVPVDIPLVDENFYGVKVREYKEELKTIGVMFEYGEACALIGKHLMSLAGTSYLTSHDVLSILNIIQFLRKKLLPWDKFIHGIKDRRWLRTSCGYKSPVGSVLFDSEWQTASQIADVPFIDQDYYGEEILLFREELQLLGVIVGFSGSHQLVIDNLKSPSYLTSLTAEAILLILECLRHSEFSDKLVNALKGTKCLKTNMGFKAPGECYLFDPEWGCILQVFPGFPLIDHKFYGGNISNYKAQLKQMGAVINYEDAMKEFTRVFRQKASVTSITKENVASLLSSYKHLKGTLHKFPSSFRRCLLKTNWLRTRLGDYRSPSHCILFGPEWESISQIALLPFIDDSDNYYGKWIYEYMDELKHMGVTVELKCGVKFVDATLRFPLDPSCITIEYVLSMLGCIRISLQENKHALPEDLVRRISRDWLKTHAGYSQDSEAGKRIWIPNGNENGEWVKPEACVLHDKDDLFSLKLNVLEKHYDKKLLPFFSYALDAKSNPSIDDYCELWREWGTCVEKLSDAECCKFWGFIVQHWNPKTEKKLAQSLMKLPAGSGSEGVFLVDKHDVFIADDLQLKHLFQQFSHHPYICLVPSA
ncbi:ATP/DNA-binding protein [Quillaja saponaria]|uniref:ATP/DNA-binding protein n=1 Tax=Quillaja saponaria TaxID=32244 RepID=A0AAD7P864_QUISA|nr:ATP/DNA-binding protein [Quillaja saponaria]